MYSIFTMGHRFKDTTPFLFYCALMFAWGGIMFGLDTGSFGAIQALPSFLSRFGTKDPKGQYELTTTRTAIMNGGRCLPSPDQPSNG